MKQMTRYFPSLIAAFMLAACGSEKADKPVNPPNDCAGQEMPANMASCDCVDGRWENCVPQEGPADAGHTEDAGSAGECDESLKPEWAVTCDCTESGWLNCKADTNCTDAEIAACESQGLQCRADGECYDARCEGVDCDPGKTCRGGGCVFNACLDKTCPSGRICNEQGVCISETGVNILWELEGGNDIVDDNGETKATVLVRLDSAPTAEVRVNLSFTGDAKDEVEVEGGETFLTFTAENWETPQRLVIVGSGDEEVDGDKDFDLVFTCASDDVDFNNLTASVDLVNRDTESASVILHLPDLLETTEDGGSVQIGVKLGGRPSSDVTIPLSVSNTNYASVSPANLVIHPDDWNTSQTITVTGRDDSAVNVPPHTYQLVFGAPVTSDAAFAAMEMPSVDLLNIDNDVPQILVNKNPFTVSESGGTDRIGVTLSTQPAAQTTITATVSPSDRCKITGGASLTFTTAADSSSTVQNVTVQGLDDNGSADGSHTCKLLLTGKSSDTNTESTYNNRTKEVSGTVLDNDVVGLSSRIVNSGRLTEAGSGGLYSESGQICYSLSSRPSQPVTLNITSSNTSTGANVSSTSLYFEPGSYKTEKCITVTAVDDGVVDGTQTVYITAGVSSADSAYSRLSKVDQFIVYDRNSYGLLTDTLGYTTFKETATAPFKFKLGSRPTSKVTVTLSSNDTSEISIYSPSSKTVEIEPDDWNYWQTARIEGVSDNAYDGTQNACVILKTSSSDSYYNNKSTSLCYSIEDIDSPGISLSCTSTNGYAACDDSATYGGNVVALSDQYSGRQGSVTCSVSLTKKPSQDVYVYVEPTQSNGGHDGFSNSPGYTTSYTKSQTVKFTSADYATPQKVTFYYTAIPAKTTYNGNYYKAYDSFTMSASTNSTAYPASNVTTNTSYKRYNICEYYYFKYKNKVRSIELPPGNYLLRAWGASGGSPDIKSMKLNSTNNGFACRNHGGAGAYVYGTLTLTTKQTLYVRTGQAGIIPGNPSNPATDKAYNGGGHGRGGGASNKGGGGGGGTDFCLSPYFDYCATDSDHWPYRILVAGGGGGGPDPAECYSNDYSYGANARTPENSSYPPSDGGTHKNSLTYDNGVYYAQSGSREGKYTSDGSGHLFFGTGMSTSNCNSNKDGYSRAGGGGGWYGGLAYCGSTSEVGGGAGSSYAFTGTRHGEGKQSDSYPLTNVGGYYGGTVMPYEVIKSDGFPDWTAHFGNIGDGFAIIEVLTK